MRITTEPVVTERALLDADCVARGAASDLYLALWNRGDHDDLAITGDASVLANFNAGVRVRWS
jgi:hypothetical protein